MAAARVLRKCDAEIILIDRRNHHIFQPLLYQVATAVLAPSEIAVPIRKLTEKQKNLSVLWGEIKDLKPSPRPFRYFDKGNMAVIGKNFAVRESGRIRMSGFLAWLAWAFVHIVALPERQNRMRVRMQWLWSYFTGQRSSLLMSERPQRGK
jgi:NADH dehydrogenase FAD-containing subunit